MRVRLDRSDCSDASNILMPLFRGTAAANGGGDIDVANNATYDVAWLSTGYAICTATLIKSPF